MKWTRVFAVLAILCSTTSMAQSVAPPFDSDYSITDLGSVAGLPTNYGGLTFKAGDPNTLIIGGKANNVDGRFYEVPLIRGAGNHITGFGTPRQLGFGAFNDGGVAFGPGGVLFYSKYGGSDTNKTGQVKPGENADTKVVDLDTVNVTPSPGALGFVPPGFGGAGRLKVCSYSGGQFYNLAYSADGNGTFNITGASLEATLQGGPEGFIYAPSGSPQFSGPTLLVTEYSANKVAAYDVDGNGDPLVATRRDFITGLSGGEGATIDPVTGDFLFSTFGGGSRVIQVRGFKPPPPPATVSVSASVNPSFEGDDVTFTAQVVSNTNITPTGSVTFQDGGIDISGCVDVAVNSGTAACTASALAFGNHPIEAFYSGDADNAAASGALTQQVLAPPPGGVGNGNRLWVDAADTRTLFADAACTQPVTVSGHEVACWKDKSASGTDVIDVGASNGEPTWLTNQFNGKPALEFRKAESDTLRHVLSSPWTGPYTEFVVFEQQGTPTQYDSFFSNGAAADSTHHQITFLNNEFEWFNNSANIAFEGFSNELKLYAVRGNASSTEVFVDGERKNTSTETGGRTFAQYRINQNRSGDRLNNAKIAEVIVYERALNDCEIEDVNFYLGTKYGRDFFQLKTGTGGDTGWSYPAPFDQDVNGIAAIPGACPQPKTIDTAVSDIVTLDNPFDLDANERLLIGHNGVGLQTDAADVPFGFDARLAQVWQIDADQLADGVTVDISFNVGATGGAQGNSIDLSDADQLALLIGDDAGNMAMADLSPIGAVVTGTTVTFPGVQLGGSDDGRYFTLAHQLPPGLFVHNAGPIDYPVSSPARVVAPSLELSFLDPATQIDEAKVNIAENYQDGADVLGLDGQTGTSGTVGPLPGGATLNWSFDAGIGVLSFTGSGIAEDYQQALREVTFRSSSTNAAQRKLTFSVGSGLQFPGTGHFYQYQAATGGITWTDARNQAQLQSYFGLQGYLATVTSQAESDFILGKLKGNEAWIGASDAATADEWRWVTGPEGLEDGGAGRVFSQGATPVGGAFTNWNPNEPNNSGDAAYFIGAGCTWSGCTPSKWDDIPSSRNEPGYVVEYGGLPNDPQLHLADDAFVNVLLPQVTLSKTAADPTPNTVSDLTYTLTFENIGAADALNVQLIDALPTSPSGATFVSASDGGTESGGVVTWDIGTIAAGDSGTRTVTIRTPQKTGTMSNTATLSAADLPADVQATETVTLVGPTLVIDLDAPAGAAVGSQISFTIDVSNSGSGDATNSNIRFLPGISGLVFDSASSSAGCAPLPPPDQDTISCDTGMIAAGASASRTLVYTAPAAPTSLSVAASFGADQLANRLQATASVYVTDCMLASEACLEKTFSPGTVSIPQGQTSTLQFRLVNGTDAASRAVSFTDTLPAGLVLVGAPSADQCNGSGIVSGIDGGNTITVSGAPLGGTAPQSCTISVSVRGLTGGAKTNAPGNFSATANVDVSTASATLNVTEPELAVSVAAPASVLAQEQFSYSITLQNTGNEDAAGVVLTQTLPSGVSFVSASPGNSRAGNDVSWTVGTLAAGETQTYRVTVTAPPTPTSLGSSAEATATNAATATAANTVTVTGQPNFTVTIVDTPDPVQDGSNLGYLITVTNTGPVPAIGSVLTIDVPTNTTFVAASSGGSNSSGTVSWILGDLGAGASTSVSLTVDTVAPLANGTLIDASATADATNLPSPVTATAQTTVQSEPSLGVTLTATPSIVEAGAGLQYTVDFENTGTDTAAATRLELNLPSGFQLSTVTGSNAQQQGSTIVWDLGDVLAGQSGSFIVTGVTNSGLPDNSTLVASAVLSSTTACGPPPQPCGATALASTRIESAPDLSLSIDAPVNVSAGGSLTYSLDYFNSGNQDATSTRLTLFLPPNTAFVRADNGGGCFTPPGDPTLPPIPCVGFSDGSQVIEWNLGTVPLNAGGRVTATLTVRAPLSDGTSLVANGELLSIAPGAPPAVTAQATTTVVSTAVLDLDVQAPPLVSPGAPLLYEFDFLNVGTDVAPNAVLETRIPTNTTFVSATGSFTQIGDTVRWDLGDVGARLGGKVNLLVEVDPVLPNGTSLINNASISSDTTPPLSQSTTTRVISAPIPTLIKTSQPAAVVAAGKAVTYTLAYGNAGDEDMLNARLVDHLPAGYVPGQIGGGGVFDAATGTITWGLGTLAAGAQGGTHTFTITVPSGTVNGTRIVNSATLESDNSQPVASLYGIEVTSTPILVLTVTAPPQVDAGGDITYTLKYENRGNATARVANIEVTLPPETSYDSATGLHAHSTNQVNWPLGDVQPGGTGTVTVTARVSAPLPDGTGLVNVASFKALNATEAARLTFSTVHSEPVLNVSKIAPNVIGAGQVLPYIVFWSNTGTDQATGVVVEDALPSNVSFDSAGQGGVYDPASHSVSWDLGDVPAGLSGTLDLSVIVDDPITGGTILVNTADIASNETPSRAGQARTTVLSQPSYGVTLTSSPANVVEAGSGVTMTLGYGNSGTQDGANAVLTALLPPGVVNITASSNAVAPVIDAASHTVTWPIGVLPAGASGGETVSYVVPLGTANGTFLLNMATLHGDDAPAASTGVPLLVDAKALLTLGATANVQAARPGQPVSFALAYGNGGNLAADGVVVTAALPAGFSGVSALDGGVFDPNTRSVSWNLGSLPPGSAGTVRVEAVVDLVAPPADGTSLTVTAALAASPPPGEPPAPPVAASATVRVTAPVLELSKSGSPTAPAAGGELIYMLSYRNTGSAPATQLVIDDWLDPNLEFVSASNGGLYKKAKGTVSWTLPDLAAGASGEVTLTTRVASPLANGTVIPNFADILALEVKAAPGLATASHTVSSAPVLVFEKRASADSNDLGSVVTFTMTIENTGNEVAANLLLVDPLPSGTEFVAASDGGFYNDRLGEVQWLLGDLAPGDGPIVRTLQLRTLAPVTNTAIVSGDNVAAQSASAPVGLNAAVDVSALSAWSKLLLVLLLAASGAVLVRRLH